MESDADLAELLESEFIAQTCADPGKDSVEDRIAIGNNQAGKHGADYFLVLVPADQIGISACQQEGGNH